MNSFTYSYPVKVYFGEKAAAKNLSAELANIGPNVMLAYGGGSIKKNGIYDELLGVLKDAGKTVTEFAGIMSNPTYAKVQDARSLASVIGEDELSDTDKKYMEFGREFEQRFLKQGFDENRSMEQTLELAWDLLSLLPASELDRMNAKLIEEHYRK